MRVNDRRRRLVFALLASGVAFSGARARADAPVAEVPAREVEARLRFDRGRALLKDRAYDAALAEFLASRALVRTRGNTQNAAVCLREVGRLDEALDLFEELLRDPALTAAERPSVEAEIASLRTRVGTLEIVTNEPGAVVTIDGLERGRAPLSTPIRVNAGTHDVRVMKRGFRPSEARVEVAGATRTRLDLQLEPLLAAGRLVVREASDAPATVIVDHAEVGEAPWEGSLAPGDHVVVLRAANGMGTQPVGASVRADDVTQLRLSLEALPAALRIEPRPVDARVTLDAVPLGRGVWHGAVRAGDHTIDVLEDGYFARRSDVTVAAGESARVAVVLDRDPRAPRWQRDAPARFVFDARLGLVVAPSLGGDLDASCKGACRAGWLTGVAFGARASYELGVGLGLGVELGALRAAIRYTARPTEVRPFGREPSAAEVDDSLSLTAVLLGAAVSYRTSGTYRFAVDLGVGAALGTLRDRRSGAFDDRDGARTSFGPWAALPPFRALYLAPALRVGRRLGARLELGAELRATLLVALTLPRGDSFGDFVAGRLGLARFSEERFVGDFPVLVSPSAYARYDF